MNPSTGDFETAINAIPNEEIILLPNNKNVLLAAKQAAERAKDKRVHVVPSFFIPQGIAAMFEYINVCGDEASPCEIHEVAEAMTSALTNVVTCELTHATRDVDLGEVQVQAGQIIGLINDNLVVSGSNMHAVAISLLKKANAEKKERVTIYFGSDSSHEDTKRLVAALQQSFGRLEYEIVEGGQALYPYIISVE
jgi:uncharacterized protein